MACELSGNTSVVVCSLNEQNGYLLNGCTKKSRLKKMGVQHTERYVPPVKSPPATIESFCFRPTSPKASIFPSVEKRKLYRNKAPSADRRFFHVKSRIEKTCLQEQIDRAEKARKTQLKAGTLRKNFVDNLEEWKESVRCHEIIWKREVLKHLFCPAYSSFWEEEEFVLEPAIDLFLFEEEDCF